jgi:hypothetical protein
VREERERKERGREEEMEREGERVKREEIISYNVKQSRGI